jgi:3-dehydroquinate synthase
MNYLDLPTGFATQTAIIEKPLPEYLPDSPWLLLGDASARPVWLSHGMPEPPVAAWVQTSEAAKRLETILPWLESWATQNIHRKYTLVVAGGGVLTDMGGLAAALYMRGIDWHSWPTTLLAQIDAGIGGKTAVNLDSGKNLAGAFHHPQRAVIATAFLESLPEKHLMSGKWELLKTALIEGDLAWAGALLDCVVPSVCDMRRAIGLKIKIVSKDERDRDDRRLLNLGHTLGHAFESASGFGILHGEAVGLGTLWACLLSENQEIANFPPDFIKKMAKRLAAFSQRIPAWEATLPHLMRDKKNELEKNAHCIIPIPGSYPMQKKISYETLESVHAKLLEVLNSH